jgi:hypothetical protein
MKNINTLMKTCCLSLLIAALVGCSGKYSGGGAMPSASGIEGEKATFGFTIHAENDGIDCNNITRVTGQFQYVDHGTGVNVAFHAKVREFAGGFADADFNTAPLFLCDYYVKGKVAGQVLVGALDYGSDQKIDHLVVVVLNGPYAGYSNGATFEKGNITYKPDSLCE